MKSTTFSNHNANQSMEKKSLIRRILRYAKPYSGIVVIALISLFAATAFELSMPVIIQQTIDEHLLNRYVRLSYPDQKRLESDDDYKSAFIKIRILDDNAYFIKDKKSDIKVNEDEKYIITPFQENHTSLPGTIGDRTYTAVQVSMFSTYTEDQKNIFQESNYKKLIEKAILFFIMLTSALVFSFLQIYTITRLGQLVMQDIRMDVFRHSIHQSSRFLQDTPIGQLVSTVSNDVETINELFTSVLTSLIKDFAIMGGVIGVLFIIDANLAKIVVLTLPPIAVITYFFRIKARDAFRAVRSHVAKVHTYLQEHIGGMGLIQIFNREKSSADTFAENNRELRNANLKEAYLFAIFRPVSDFLAAIALGAVIYFGAQQYLAQFVSLGVIIAFLNLVMKFFEPVQDIAEKYTLLQSAVAGGERVFKLLDTDERIPDTGSVIERPESKDILFSHVDFSYKEESPVLKNFNLHIKDGQTIGLVGYTGSGKTTIAKLLTRLWEPQNGSISIGGTAVSDFPLKTLRTMVQPIQQDVLLFNGTVKDNLCLGMDFPESEIEEALKKAQAHEFVMKMSNGIETMLNSRGTNISTGQRQLLAFARIALHNPDIVIFDEATAHIDSETEHLIQKAMDETLKNKTAIIIAHRLSTIKHTDKIIVLAAGEIQESGDHNELMNKKGLYYDLYSLQYVEE